MVAWLAYGNATSVRALPQSAVKRPAAPPVDDGMLSQTLPSISIPAPQAAAIVDEPTAALTGRPALVMLPQEERKPPKASASGGTAAEERASRPALAVKTAPAKAAAPRQVAKSTKAPCRASRGQNGAAKKPKAATRQKWQRPKSTATSPCSARSSPIPPATRPSAPRWKGNLPGQKVRRQALNPAVKTRKTTFHRGKRRISCALGPTDDILYACTVITVFSATASRQVRQFPMIKVLENEFYYLDNFHRVLEWIGERYADLLTDEEHAFMARFPPCRRPRARCSSAWSCARAPCSAQANSTTPKSAARSRRRATLLPTGWIEQRPGAHARRAVRPAAPNPKSAPCSACRCTKKARARPSSWTPCAPNSATRAHFPAGTGLRRRRLQHPGQAPVRPPAPDLLRQPAPGLDRVRAVRPRHLQVRAGRVLGRLARLSQPARHRRLPELHSCKERFDAGEDRSTRCCRTCRTAAFENDWLDSRRESLMFQIAQHVEKQKDWTSALRAVRALPLSRRARRARSACWKKTAQYGSAFALLTERKQRARERRRTPAAGCASAPRLARKLGHDKHRRAPQSGGARGST